MLPLAGETGVQVCTGAVGKSVVVPQVMVIQLLPDAAVCATPVQLATGVGPVVAVLQVIVIQLLVLLPVCGVQVCTNVTEPPLPQVVVKPLVGPLGVQLDTPVGPVRAVPQLVVVYWLFDVGLMGLQVETAVGPVVIGALQVVAV